MLDDQRMVARRVDHTEVRDEGPVPVEVEHAARDGRAGRLRAALRRRILEALEKLRGLRSRDRLYLRRHDDLAASRRDLANRQVEALALLHAERQIGDEDAGLTRRAGWKRHVAHTAARQ